MAVLLKSLQIANIIGNIWEYLLVILTDRDNITLKKHSNNNNNNNNTDGSLNLGQTTRHSDSQQKKRICRIVDFVFQANHRVKLKDGEKRDKYQDLARELKRLLNMKVTVIPIVVGTLGTIPKRLVKRPEDLEIRGKVEIIHTKTFLRSARILRSLLDTWEDLLTLRSKWKTTR